jgi:hypothetical protein
VQPLLQFARFSYLNCFVGAHGRSGVVCQSLFLPVELTEARKRTALVIIVIETKHAANGNTVQGFGSSVVSILPRVLTARPGLSIGTFELVALMENMTRIRRMLEGPPDLNRVLFDPLDLSEYL